MLVTFMEFSFMGALFLAMWAYSSDTVNRDLRRLKDSLREAPWPLMVTSHIFGTFWLQSLMMPSQVVSLGFFAATRAAEVPVAAAWRSWALSLPSGGHSVRSIGLMTIASLALFYSYVQMEGCLCIWSGHGVFLTGFALYFIYAIMLAVPAVQATCQEIILVRHNIHPLLLLSATNFAAALLISPIFLLEQVRDGLAMLDQYNEVLLLSMWLCVQVAATAVVSLAIIRYLGSFWAVALRGMRVVYWWCCQLVAFYLSSDTLLSIAHPSISMWSFLMVLGIALAIGAMAMDSRLHSFRSTAAVKGQSGRQYDSVSKV